MSRIIVKNLPSSVSIDELNIINMYIKSIIAQHLTFRMTENRNISTRHNKIIKNLVHYRLSANPPPSLTNSLRLMHWFGLHGTSLDWFSSYLTSRSLKQSPSKIPLHLSQIFLVVYLKVPSLAHFFSLFIHSWLCHLEELNQVPPDDTQLYISFTPSNSTSSLEMLSNTFSDILSWMNSNKLLLNPSKTEFLLIGTKQQRLKFSQLTTLSLGNDIIPVSSSARNLGFIFDSDMSFTDKINSLSKSCHFRIRDIRRIRHLLPLSAATALANSLVSSKLDYCNSLYNGISQANLNKIQRIQNTLARVVTNTSKFEHITPILKKLHWLPIKQRIDYKLCLLTYKTLQIQQPTYLNQSINQSAYFETRRLIKNHASARGETRY